MDEIKLNSNIISKFPTESLTLKLKVDDYKLLGAYFMMYCLEDEANLDNVLEKVIIHELSRKMEKKYVDIRHDLTKEKVKLKLSPIEIVAVFLCIGGGREEDVYLNTLLIQIVGKIHKLLV